MSTTTIADLAANSPLTYAELSAANKARTLVTVLAELTPAQRVGAAAVVAERRGCSVGEALAVFGRLADEAAERAMLAA